MTVATLNIRKVNILGVSVATLSSLEAVEVLDSAAASGVTTKLAFLNAHGSNIAANDGAFARALTDFLVLNDGIGVDIAAMLLHGNRFPENLNGTDFTVNFLQKTNQTWNIFLLGAKPGIAATAAKTLANLAPRHQIAGVADGYFDPTDSTEIAHSIRASGANLLLVAMGNPAQEIWIAQHGAATGCQIMMGVGALFDFLAGEVSRAPEWVRQLRLEWVYRLMLEPRRLARRYLVGNPYFLARTLRARIINSPNKP